MAIPACLVLAWMPAVAPGRACPGLSPSAMQLAMDGPRSLPGKPEGGEPSRRRTGSGNFNGNGNIGSFNGNGNSGSFNGNGNRANGRGNGSRRDGTGNGGEPPSD